MQVSECVYLSAFMFFYYRRNFIDCYFSIKDHIIKGNCGQNKLSLIKSKFTNTYVYVEML